ncbi:MAG: hypothetical protein V4510_09900 [bacterium]
MSSTSACRWARNCRLKVRYRGHHWGATFDVCSKHVARARKWFEVTPIEPKWRRRSRSTIAR